jgi:hypothetical protein
LLDLQPCRIPGHVAEEVHVLPGEGSLGIHRERQTGSSRWLAGQTDGRYLPSQGLRLNGNQSPSPDEPFR